MLNKHSTPKEKDGLEGPSHVTIDLRKSLRRPVPAPAHEAKDAKAPDKEGECRWKWNYGRWSTIKGKIGRVTQVFSLSLIVYRDPSGSEVKTRYASVPAVKDKHAEAWPGFQYHSEYAHDRTVEGQGSAVVAWIAGKHSAAGRIALVRVVGRPRTGQTQVGINGSVEKRKNLRLRRRL